jgi:response regulator of citrate/malate metabolism
MKAELNKFFNEETEKVLRTLLDEPEREFNKKELAEEAEISRDALYRRWDDLEQLEVIKKVDNKFTLNQDGELIDELESILDTLSEKREQ